MKELRAAASGLFLLSLASSTLLATLSFVERLPIYDPIWF